MKKMQLNCVLKGIGMGNNGEKGEIVITKRSLEFNERTGLSAEASLVGAGFENSTIAGNIIDKAVSDSK